MLCTTCYGKGYISRPHHAPCPECHAGCQHCCDGDTMPTPPSYGNDDEGKQSANLDDATD